MDWDLWVDFMRTDGAGLTHASMRNARPGLALHVDDHTAVGNEDAESAVARVVSIDPGGIVLLTVLPGPLRDHGYLVRRESAPT